MRYEARYKNESGRTFWRVIVADHEGDLEDILNRAAVEADSTLFADGMKLVELKTGWPTFEVTAVTTDRQRFTSFRQEETRAEAIKHAIDAITFDMGGGFDLEIATVDVERVAVGSYVRGNGTLAARWILAD